MFSTDLSTLKLSCASYTPNILDADYMGNLSCGAWYNNSVGQDPKPGYGPGLAFEPAFLNFDWPAQGGYVSNSSNKLAMLISVKDQAGTPVTPGLIASLLTACAYACDRV